MYKIYTLILLISLMVIGNLHAQAQRLPPGAKPLAGNGEPTQQSSPYPPAPPPPGYSTPSAPTGDAEFQTNQVVGQPQQVDSYKSDLPPGWDQAPQVQPGEITLEELSGKPWKPAPAGGADVEVEEEIPVYKNKSKGNKKGDVQEENIPTDSNGKPNESGKHRWDS